MELFSDVTYPHVHSNYRKNIHDEASEEIDAHLEEKAESSTGRLCCNHDPKEWEDRDASPDDVSNFPSVIAVKCHLHLIHLGLCHSLPLEGHSGIGIIIKIDPVVLLIAILDTFAVVKIPNCSDEAENVEDTEDPDADKGSAAAATSLVVGSLITTDHMSIDYLIINYYNPLYSD